MTKIEKLVIVTKKTFLEGLIEKFNTKDQAKFYIEHMGGSFRHYDEAHIEYKKSLEKLKRSIPSEVKFQIVERSFIPNFLFNPSDLIVVFGPDGLVINTAKYLENQLILAINPDPSRIGGVLIPFKLEDFENQLKRVTEGNHVIKHITMAKAELNDQQKMYGVNDLFVGHRSHVSFRYKIKFRDKEENQISSGLIITTGAGSTGWYKSVVSGAIAVFKSVRAIEENVKESDYRFPWDSEYLCFSVREPWKSQISKTNIVFDKIYRGEYLEIESQMPEGGKIFSDGIENDYLQFDSGKTAKIGVAEKKANLN